MITLKEIAERCNVSIATVSNILNGKSNVSETTKKNVLEVIKETGYKPNFFASRLRATRTKTIGLLIDDLTSFSSPDIIQGAVAFLEEKGYKAIIETVQLYSKFDNNPSNQEYKDAVLKTIDGMGALRVEGIVFISAYAHEIDFLPENLDIPLIIAYSYPQKNNFIHVNIDDFNSAYTITDYIIKKGHKNIAVITGAEGIHTRDRCQGFTKAMCDNNLPVNSELFAEGNWKRDGGYEAAKKIVPLKPDAIFCLNDLMAAGVYDYMYENSLTPGKDIAVAGFDNQIIAEYLNPPLTTMEIQLKEIGQKTSEILLKKINGTKSALKSEGIACRLIERKSV